MKANGQLKKLLFILIFLSAVVIPFSLAQAQQPVFRIGIIDNLTGPIANGARLAINEINTAGGVVGADGTVFRLEAVIQPPDDLASAVTAINSAAVIAVIGPETTAQMLNGMPILQTLNVPIITPAIGDTIIVSDTSGLVFRSRAPEILQGRALANYITSDLNVTNIATVQLDLDSTAGVIGLSTALSAAGRAPLASLLLDGNTTIPQIADTILRQNVDLVATYGPPDIASQLYNQLRASGWEGFFAYNQATNNIFRNAVSPDQLDGILSTTTWSLASNDPTSSRFLTLYARAFLSTPDPVAAASYDAVYLLAEAIKLPGDLQSNLASLSNIQGVQGILNPAGLTRGETSNNVVVTRLNALGGPEVVARYAGNQRLQDDNVISLLATPTPQPTATPEGVYVVIRSSVQNVRTGPSTQYDVLGQLQRDETARVIGASIDFSWVVIEYRGQNGWLFADLLDIFGDTSTVPVIPPPPTPTPGPPTPTPTAAPIADIVVLAATPPSLVIGSAFNVTVTIRNQGSVDAGPFAVAASFFPGDVYSAVNLAGLGAGQQTTLNLTGVLGTGATGPQNVIIVADLNNQLDEGPAGEANNIAYTYSYIADRPILNARTLTLNPGSTLNLEGVGTDDLSWNGNSLDAHAGMYLLSGVSSFNQVHRDFIEPSLATAPSLNVAVLPNSYIGIITSEGNRGVLHVDSVTVGGPITLTYRVYQP